MATRRRNKDKLKQQLQKNIKTNFVKKHTTDSKQDKNSTIKLNPVNVNVDNTNLPEPGVSCFSDYWLSGGTVLDCEWIDSARSELPQVYIANVNQEFPDHGVTNCVEPNPCYGTFELWVHNPSEQRICGMTLSIDGVWITMGDDASQLAANSADGAELQAYPDPEAHVNSVTGPWDVDVDWVGAEGQDFDTYSYITTDPYQMGNPNMFPINSC
tara:strand:- start:28 stop:666 length:639 start_codon:yes stop_codon:yes gene_type:complete